MTRRGICGLMLLLCVVAPASTAQTPRTSTQQAQQPSDFSAEDIFVDVQRQAEEDPDFIANELESFLQREKMTAPQPGSFSWLGSDERASVRVDVFPNANTVFVSYIPRSAETHLSDQLFSYFAARSTVLLSSPEECEMQLPFKRLAKNGKTGTSRQSINLGLDGRWLRTVVSIEWE